MKPDSVRTLPSISMTGAYMLMLNPCIPYLAERRHLFQSFRPFALYCAIVNSDIVGKSKLLHVSQVMMC